LIDSEPILPDFATLGEAKFNGWGESNEFSEFSDFDSMSRGKFDDMSGESRGQSRRQTGRIDSRRGEYTTSVMFHDIHLPSFPLVKPVRKFLPLCMTFVVAALMATESDGQITRRTRNVRQSERVARANWQPTRTQPAARSQTEPQNQLRTGVGSTDSSVQNVQAISEVVPTPPPDSAISIVDRNRSANLPQPEVLDGQIIEGQVIEGPILDGQVQLAPVYGGDACDAIGGCGCGDPLCVGCDGTLACDSCGDTCCGELCSPEAWRPCITLCMPQDGWISYEFLSFYQDELYLPPLVTTSVDPSISRSQAGVLTNPATRVIYGGPVLSDSIDGGRLRFGVWLDRCHTWGLGGELIEMSEQSETFLATSEGLPILARPFFNTQTGVEDAELVAYPDVLSGSVGVQVKSKFEGAGFHIRRLRRSEEGCKKWLFCGCPDHYCLRAELLVGYRYLQLQESVMIRESLVSQESNNPGSFEILDSFETKNQFNGIDLGWLVRSTRGYWTVDGSVRLAIGNNRQTVKISGQSAISDPSSVPNMQTYPAGFLALSSNVGSYTRDEFAVVPEFGLTVGYQLTDHLRMTIGYTGIYWSNVVRPGHHIDRDVNPNLLPPVAVPTTGANRPSFAFDTTDYWIQGISLGGEYRW
jgi:hypothetical protein